MILTRSFSDVGSSSSFDRFMAWDFSIGISAIQGHPRLPEQVSEAALGAPLDRRKQNSGSHLGLLFLEFGMHHGGANSYVFEKHHNMQSAMSVSKHARSCTVSASAVSRNLRLLRPGDNILLHRIPTDAYTGL